MYRAGAIEKEREMIRPLLTLLGILAVSLVFADPSAAQQSSGTAAKTTSTSRTSSV